MYEEIVDLDFASIIFPLYHSYFPFVYLGISIEVIIRRWLLWLPSLCVFVVVVPAIFVFMKFIELDIFLCSPYVRNMCLILIVNEYLS